MSGSIWLIMYDVAAADEAKYLGWFHGVHIPEKLARPGYTWAAHYEVITPDGQARALADSTPTSDQRGFVAVFGGEDTRTFLNPSPAQIKPTQPPLTREMMALRISSRMLVAAEEWRLENEDGIAPAFEFLSVALCDAEDNDEDYGAWCIQKRAPHLQASPGFEVAAKMLSATNAAKHLMVASFQTLENLSASAASEPADEWSDRVRNYQAHAPGTPLLARRIA